MTTKAPLLFTPKTFARSTISDGRSPSSICRLPPPPRCEHGHRASADAFSAERTKIVSATGEAADAAARGARVVAGPPRRFPREEVPLARRSSKMW